MNFNAPTYKSAEAARRALERMLPEGTHLDELREFMIRSGAICHELEKTESNDLFLPCNLLEPSTTMVHVDWGFDFVLNEDFRLVRIDVHRGIVGP